MPKVQIKVATELRRLLPDKDLKDLDLPEGATAADVLRVLNFPGSQNYLVALNDQMLIGSKRDQAVVREGDTIGVFPPLKGG